MRPTGWKAPSAVSFVDRPLRQARHRPRRVVLEDQPRRVRGRAAGLEQRALVDDHDLVPAALGEMVGDAGAGDAGRRPRRRGRTRAERSSRLLIYQLSSTRADPQFAGNALLHGGHGAEGLLEVGARERAERWRDRGGRRARARPRAARPGARGAGAITSWKASVSVAASAADSVPGRGRGAQALGRRGTRDPGGHPRPAREVDDRARGRRA